MTIDNIKEIYGDVSLESLPLDIENPEFGSLLGALKSLHTNEISKEDFLKYFNGLYEGLLSSRKIFEEMPDEQKDDVVLMTVGGFSMAIAVLDVVKMFIDNPTDENLANAIDAYLRCQPVFSDLNDIYDNIKGVGDNELSS